MAAFAIASFIVVFATSILWATRPVHKSGHQPHSH